MASFIPPFPLFWLFGVLFLNSVRHIEGELISLNRKSYWEPCVFCQSFWQEPTFPHLFNDKTYWLLVSFVRNPFAASHTMDFVMLPNGMLNCHRMFLPSPLRYKNCWVGRLDKYWWCRLRGDCPQVFRCQYFPNSHHVLLYISKSGICYGQFAARPIPLRMSF